MSLCSLEQMLSSVESPVELLRNFETGHTLFR